MQPHKIVSPDEWVSQRKALLAKEKELTRLRDKLNAERRDLPWVKVEKTYVFDTPEGKKTLADLFAGRSQLLAYHFMLGPGWEEGCPSCSYLADHFDGSAIHLAHRDVAFVAVSRAPLPEIEAFKTRMGWRFKWVSSSGSDFNFDYHVSFTPEQIAEGKAYYNYDVRPNTVSEQVGISVFYRSERSEVFHTYSCYSRGVDMLNGAYHYLDLAPKGRDEDGLEFTMEWVRRHDQY
jgi:predicted dithiol-disulfide oxidoreductase (DUF899 family)